MFEESRAFEQPPEPSLVTMTGEPYQPTRLFYWVGQKNAVIGRFRRLRCIDEERTHNRWVWFLTEEAKKIKFTKSYQDIPKEHRPLVLGYFTFKGNQQLRLDVDSFDRAIEAIKFFDEKINRRLAKVSKIQVVNQLFPATTTPEEISEHHVVFFEQGKAVNPKDEMEQLEEIVSQYEGEERQQATLAFFEKQMKKPLPQVEELETHFYEDGIESVVMSLRMRQIEAREHWNGNKNFSQFDIIETLAKNFEQEEL